MVLENVDVTTRAYRVHFDFAHSQVMECVTCSLKEKTRVRSGVAVRRGIPRHPRGPPKTQDAIQCAWNCGVSSKYFC